PLACQPAGELKLQTKEIIINPVAGDTVVVGLDQLPGNCPGLIGDDAKRSDFLAADLAIGLSHAIREELKIELPTDLGQFTSDFLCKKKRTVDVVPAIQLLELGEKIGLVPFRPAEEFGARDWSVTKASLPRRRMQGISEARPAIVEVGVDQEVQVGC